MTPETLRIAIAEAKRFLKFASLVKCHQQKKTPGTKPYEWIKTGRDSGACRRASMDLTRALADLRR